MSGTNSSLLDTADEREREVKIVSHSNLFYWWPVWVAGYLMALLTYWDGHLMAIVPEGTVAQKDCRVEGYEQPCDGSSSRRGKGCRPTARPVR